MFPRKAAPSVECHEKRIAADSDGDRHLQQQDCDPVFVPGIVGNGFGGRVCGIHQYLTSTEFKEPGLQLPLCFFCSQRLRQQTMFFRIALIARGPKVEHDEGQKHVERYIEVAHVYV